MVVPMEIHRNYCMSSLVSLVLVNAPLIGSYYFLIDEDLNCVIYLNCEVRHAVDRRISIIEKVISSLFKVVYCRDNVSVVYFFDLDLNDLIISRDDITATVVEVSVHNHHGDNDFSGNYDFKACSFSVRILKTGYYFVRVYNVFHVHWGSISPFLIDFNELFQVS